MYRMRAWMLVLPVDALLVAAPAVWDLHAVKAHLAMSVLFVLLVTRGGRYQARLHLSVLDELPGLLIWLLTCAALVATVSALRHDQWAVTHFLANAAIAVGLVMAGRVLTTWLINWSRRRGLSVHPTVVIGGGPVAAELVRILTRYPRYGLSVVGYVEDDARDAAALGTPRLGGSADLDRVVVETGANVLLIADCDISERTLLDAVRTPNCVPCDLLMVPRLHYFHTQTGIGDHIGSVPIMRIQPPKLAGLAGLVKRTFDLFAAFGGLFAAAPIVGASVLALRFERGPGVFVRETRVGREGEQFELLKLRTIRAVPGEAVDPVVEWSEMDADRGGPIGRVIRRFSIDELPQLWNVLRGDMTLVGPRPEPPYFVEQFSSRYDRFGHRHRAKVGMTGLAQVSGLRGEGLIVDRARHDNYYIENWSVWLDLKILVRTLAEVWHAAPIRAGGDRAARDRAARDRAARDRAARDRAARDRAAGDRAAGDRGGIVARVLIATTARRRARTDKARLAADVLYRTQIPLNPARRAVSEQAETTVVGDTRLGGEVGTLARIALSAGAETPAYIYDLAEVRANAARLREAIPGRTELYYSLKANPYPPVLGELRRLGVRPEVCSPGELDAALDAGWPGAEVFYTGPGKRDRDVARALALGVRSFCVDSPTGLDQLDRLAERAAADVRCLVRVNDDQPVSGQGLAMTGVASQFGADVAWIVAEPDRFAGRSRVSVVGLHLYMGTNMTAVDALLAQFARSLTCALRVGEALAGYGVTLEEVNLGGGFGAPFAAEGPPVDLAGLRAGLTEMFDERLPDWRDGVPRLVFESGRYLVGTAGTLVTTVLDVKRSHDRDVVVLDSGINHLGGMSGLRRLPPLNPTLLSPPDAGEIRPTLVAGPLCTPLDSWSRAAPLPPLRPGELLSVPNVGAYGLTASLVAFLGHPAPIEVAIDAGRVVDMSRLTFARKD